MAFYNQLSLYHNIYIGFNKIQGWSHIKKYIDSTFKGVYQFIQEQKKLWSNSKNKT